MSRSINQQLWTYFNGRNHAELAEQYGMTVQEVFSRLRQMALADAAANLRDAVEAVVNDPQHFQSLPPPLSQLLVRAVCDLAGFDVGIQLAYCLDRKAA